MPIYTVRCKKCGKDEDIFRSLVQIDDVPEHCGEKTQRVIHAPRVISDIQPYRSMLTGQMITSRSKHRDHLKEHGCVEVGNEPMTKKKVSWLEQKQNKEALRQEIAARIDSI
jgi:putative FmdB family regulatory protein